MSRIASFSRGATNRLVHPDRLAHRIVVDPLRNQPVQHEAVRRTVDVEVQTVAEEVIVVDADHALGHELAGRGAGVIVVRGLQRRGLGLDDTGGADRDLDGAIRLEAPIEQVVVVADHRRRAQHQLATGSPVDFAALQVTPRGILGRALEETREPGREPRRPVLVDRQPVEPRGARRTVEPWRSGFRKPTPAKNSPASMKARLFQPLPGSMYGTNSSLTLAS